MQQVRPAGMERAVERRRVSEGSGTVAGERLRGHAAMTQDVGGRGRMVETKDTDLQARSGANGRSEAGHRLEDSTGSSGYAPHDHGHIERALRPRIVVRGTARVFD